jgi:hypothetical protein
VPVFPELDHRNLPPFVAQRLFFDAHPLEPDSKKSSQGKRGGVRKVALPEGDLRKAEAARRREKNEAFVA